MKYQKIPPTKIEELEIIILALDGAQYFWANNILGSNKPPENDCCNVLNID